jgi:hypothetical protein
VRIESSAPDDADR